MIKRTVLVVEDDIHLLSGIREILELGNYNVWTAQNGLQGLEKLESADATPDVIVSDIMMPHMDGFRFLAEVREKDQWVNIPFIFLTAKGEKSDVQRGNLLGADVYLKKPFDAEDLLVAVDSRLKRFQNMERVQNNTISQIKRRILITLNHELRTPLTLVVAYADLLKDFDPDNMSDNELITFLRGVNSGATRLRRLIENFILLVEIEEGDAAKTFVWRKYPIESLKDIAVDACRQILEQDANKIAITCQEDLPTVTADREFLTIIIRELVDNGVKFSGDKESVSVDIASVDNHIQITVADSGTRKISDDDIEKVWEAFYQVNRELYEDQGSGSGLSIVDGLVDIHGGSRNIISTDQGTTVTVRIPLVPSESETSDG
jgi:two-component system, sensor histidine kinase and response regulator